MKKLFSNQELVEAFKTWRDLNRGSNMNIKAVDEAWRRYCSIRDHISPPAPPKEQIDDE